MKSAKLNPKYFGLVSGVIAHLRFENSFSSIAERLSQIPDNQAKTLTLWNGNCEEWLQYMLAKSNRTYLADTIRKITISLSSENDSTTSSFVLFVEPANPMYSISNYQIQFSSDAAIIESVRISYDEVKVTGSKLEDLLSWCE